MTCLELTRVGLHAAAIGCEPATRIRHVLAEAGDGKQLFELEDEGRSAAAPWGDTTCWAAER